VITINEDPDFPTSAEARAAIIRWYEAVDASSLTMIARVTVKRWARAYADHSAYPQGYVPGDQADVDTMALRHRALRDFAVLETIGLPTDAMKAAWLDLRLITGRWMDFRYLRGERDAGSWRVPVREFINLTEADFFGDPVRWPEIITIEWDEHPALVNLMQHIRVQTLGSSPNDWNDDAFRRAAWRAYDEQGDRIVRVERTGGRWRARVERNHALEAVDA